ncbi:MAG TPA: metal-dependent transcriptional regulator [Terriglobia bacterium]|nr:metal-dependent transcriptional regulator [Terriglobia bacterium]
MRRTGYSEVEFPALSEDAGRPGVEFEMKLTISKEDYLKAIAEAEAEEGIAIAATIARWLEVTPPAVALALRRLRRDKLALVDRQGRITLTAAGQRISDRLRFRHHLVERFLHEILGMEWYKIHDEAERLEHSVSEDLERKLIEKLGRDGVCPHGNQINKSARERRKLGLQQLWEAQPGSSVRVDSMHERDRKLLEYFDQLGIRPGVRIQISSRNYDGTLTLRLGRKSVSLGEFAARKLWVSALGAD